jgi:hypothetical protein
MAIGGGTYAAMNKTLPGAYINFVSTGSNTTLGERGTAMLALPLSWGAENSFIVIEAGEFNAKALELLGYDASADEISEVRECMKRANKLLVWRVNSGSKAAASVGGLTVTAVCAGKRGNDISVSCAANPDGSFDVATYLADVAVDEQNVKNASELTANKYVSFSGASVSAAAAKKLSGGTDGTVTGASYTAFLAAAEKERFDCLGYCGTDSDVKEMFVSFTKRMREDNGRKITCVMANCAADYEGVISVKNGVVLASGAVLPAEKTVAWVTGASAAAQVNESLTNTAYDGAVDVDAKYSKSEFEQAIKAGEFVFYSDNGKARVLTDINTLTTFTPTKNSDFSGNRFIRTIDGWANDIAALFSESYMGSVTNSETGRALFKADIVKLGRQYEELDAISDFSADDISVEQGAGKRDVVVNAALKACDSMEKLYMKVTVQ